MALVKNKYVKMDWDSASFVTLAKGSFVVAGHEYDSTTHGKVTVFFNCSTAFLFISDPGTPDEDHWNGSELKSYLKENMDGRFPLNYDEYIAVIPWGSKECDKAVLERWGILAAEEDIKARLADLAPYGVEKNSPAEL